MRGKSAFSSFLYKPKGKPMLIGFRRPLHTGLDRKEVTIGGSSMLLDVLWSLRAHGPDEHKKGVVVISSNKQKWLDKVSDEHKKAMWGQQVGEFPKIVRDYLKAINPDLGDENRRPAFEDISKLQVKLVEEVQKDPRVIYIDGEVKRITPTQIEFHSRPPMALPANGEFFIYNMSEIDNAPIISVLNSDHTASNQLQTTPHKELYEHDEKKRPESVVTVGLGLSALWLQRDLHDQAVAKGGKPTEIVVLSRHIDKLDLEGSNAEIKHEKMKRFVLPPDKDSLKMNDAEFNAFQRKIINEHSRKFPNKPFPLEADDKLKYLLACEALGYATVTEKPGGQGVIIKGAIIPVTATANFHERDEKEPPLVIESVDYDGIIYGTAGSRVDLSLTEDLDPSQVVTYVDMQEAAGPTYASQGMIRGSLLYRIAVIQEGLNNPPHDGVFSSLTFEQIKGAAKVDHGITLKDEVFNEMRDFLSKEPKRLTAKSIAEKFTEICGKHHSPEDVEKINQSLESVIAARNGQRKVEAAAEKLRSNKPRA